MLMQQETPPLLSAFSSRLVLPIRPSSLQGCSNYLQLQEELDWRELSLLRDEERRIEES